MLKCWNFFNVECWDSCECWNVEMLNQILHFSIGRAQHFNISRSRGVQNFNIPRFALTSQSLPPLQDCPKLTIVEMLKCWDGEMLPQVLTCFEMRHIRLQHFNISTFAGSILRSTFQHSQQFQHFKFNIYRLCWQCCQQIGPSPECWMLNFFTMWKCWNVELLSMLKCWPFCNVEML